MKKVARVLIVLIPVLIVAQNYVLKKDVLSAGGRKMTSTGYVLQGTISQTTVGDAEDTDYKAFIGFWHPPEAIPPSAPYITQAEKTADDLKLIWNKITTDTLGNDELMHYYVMYRDTSPGFIPDGSDSIGATPHPDTTYTDDGVLGSLNSYYYLVKAVDWALNRSKKSNMGYKFNKFFNENAAATDKNWVSLPYKSPYSVAKDISDDLSSSGDPLTKITNLRDDQLFESWSFTTIPFPRWTGTNFTIVPGCAYEMVTTVDTTLVVVGANNPDGLITLNENAAATDKNWVSIPYNAVYSVAKDITDEYSSGGDPLTKLTNMRDDQLYESWSFTTVPFPRWTGTNFSIVPGRGYEFVTISDTTWNPVEYSNEIGPPLLAGRGPRTLGIEMRVGTLTEPDRMPLWSIKEGSAIPRLSSKKKIDYSDAQIYVSTVKNLRRKSDYREAGISHLVRGYFELKECDNLVFTVYRPNKPYDVLTENVVGCGSAWMNDFYLFWFDVGNFKKPWQSEDEVILIVEASKQGRGHVAVLNFTLDETVDIQELGEISLIPIPEPEFNKKLLSTRWDKVKNNNIIGYSLYQDDTRLNDEIITEQEHLAQGQANLKPVIKGGYETVYGSQAPPEAPYERMPISYSFSIYPNPFSNKMGINYALPCAAKVAVNIYDVSGRKVKTVLSEKLEPGYYKADWSGDDDIGRTVAAGVYFVQMHAEEFVSQHKVIFVR